jgi:hypothetical protein
MSCKQGAVVIPGALDFCLGAEIPQGKLPRTIKDVTIAARELQESFLWVDALRIYSF